MAVKYVTYPAADAVFAELVRREVSARPDALADAEANVRRIYPRAVFRQRSKMAGYDLDPVWYVYRDGRVSASEAVPWWTEPGTAEATFGDGGVYRSGNDEFCKLHEVPVGQISGRRWDEFATAESIAQADELWRSLVESGALARGEPIESTFTLRTAAGRVQPVEYRTAAEADGTFRTWMRAIGEV